jgi:hypothetical protein
MPESYLVRFHQDPDKGWCVLAARELGKGILVFRTPVVILSTEDSDRIDRTKLRNYVFEWSNDRVAVALGGASLLNHHDKEKYVNCRFSNNYRDGTVEVRTIQRIAEGEELIVNYGYKLGGKKLPPISLE